MYMFVYGCTYIYKQGFTIRGKKDSWQQCGRKGPLPAVKASGPHREQPHPVLLPTFSTVQKGTNIEIVSHMMGKASPKYNHALCPSFWWLPCTQELGAVTKITSGRKRTGSEARTQASISRPTLLSKKLDQNVILNFFVSAVRIMATSFYRNLPQC